MARRSTRSRQRWSVRDPVAGDHTDRSCFRSKYPESGLRLALDSLGNGIVVLECRDVTTSQAMLPMRRTTTLPINSSMFSTLSRGADSRDHR